MSVELDNNILPYPLGEQLQKLLGLRIQPQTFGEWFEEWSHSCCCTQRENLIAMSETAHRVLSAKQSFFVPCVLDAIILAIIDRTDMELETCDPQNGRVIQMKIKSNGRVEIAHGRDQFVLSFGMASNNSSSLLECCCPYLNLFTSRASFDQWARENKDIAVTALTIDEAESLAMRWAAAMIEKIKQAGYTTNP